MRRLSSGAEIELFDALDSTSLEAGRRAGEIEKTPRWIVAHVQSAGYGRRGQAWRGVRGDFAGSLIFRVPVGEGRQNKSVGEGRSARAHATSLGQVSFVAALAVASALDDILRMPSLISLKWPNDVLIDGGKAAGLLLERIEDGRGTALVIGVGVNVVSAPRDLPYRAARLIDFAHDIPAPAALAAQIDGHFWRYYADWKKNGFEGVRRLWLERAGGLGDSIRVRLPHEELEGAFEGLDEYGGLILRLGAGRRIISAGEVFLPPRRKV
jgi:BirA family biotin operon repressor/biotin-[acetyl-CoA-carboxylase] ligase